MSKPLILGYWDIRGLASPIRFLLEYGGQPWEDKLYVTGPAPNFDKSSWFDIKHSLGLDFPNNPYLIDEANNVRLSQSHAILHYLARKFNLVGTTEAELCRIDTAEFEEIDLRNSFVGLCYNPNFDTLKVGFLQETLPTKLKLWSNFLGTTNTWIAGDKLTYVDFSLCDLLDQILVLEPNALKAYKNLEDYYTRFMNLEKIQGYMNSNRYLKYPLNNRMAKFGG